MRNVTVTQRFDHYYIPEPNSGCWLWIGTIRAGYGLFWVGKKHVSAHRWNYENTYGPIPHGLDLDHLCRVTCCVNPQHLRIVTHQENMLCGINPPAEYAKRKACKYGHPFNSLDTWINQSGARICRICRNRRNRKSYWEKRARGAVVVGAGMEGGGRP